jgi:hypothetical protein
VGLSGCVETILTTTGLVSGIVWLPNGDFLFVLMNERYIRRIAQKLVSRGNVKMKETNPHTQLDTPQERNMFSDFYKNLFARAQTHEFIEITY